MPDYAKMYRHLFNIQAQVIDILQEAHREVEEMYLSAPGPELKVLNAPEADDEDSSEDE